MTDHRTLHAIAQKLDDEFHAALVAAYGKAKAGDARFYHLTEHSDPEVIRTQIAYSVAIDKWQTAYVQASRPPL